MDAAESGRSPGSKRDYVEIIEHDEDWEHADGRQHQSSKSRKNTSDQVEEQESGKRRKSGGSSRADTGGGGDCDSRRESDSKFPRNDTDEPRSSDEYHDKESDGSLKNRDGEHESKYSRKSFVWTPEGDLERVQSKGSIYAEMKEVSSREKDYALVEEQTSPPSIREEEVISGAKDGSGYSDSKHGLTRVQSPGSPYESSKDKSRVGHLGGEKEVRLGCREETQTLDLVIEDSRYGYNEEKVADEERCIIEVQSSTQDEDDRPFAQLWDTVADDRQAKSQERSLGLVENTGTEIGNQHEVESKEGSANMDTDGHTRNKDKSGMEVGHIQHPGSPERSGRQHRESDEHYRDVWNDKAKEMQKDTNQDYRDERSSKGNDSSWNANSPKEHLGVSQFRKDTKDPDRVFADVKESDSQRRDQEGLGSEKLHGRHGLRRDNTTRSEDGKTSSSFRNAYQKSDSIEIKPTMNFDFEREASVSTLQLRRTEVGSDQDSASGMREEEHRYPSEGRDTMAYTYTDDLSERLKDGVPPVDKISRRHSFESHDGKGRGQRSAMDSNYTGPGQSTTGSQLPSIGDNQGPGSFNRGLPQGPKGGRSGRGGRWMTGRDVQRVGTPLPMMPPPFNPLGLTSGQLQPMGPNMSHMLVQPMPPSLLFPPLSGPLIWPGACGVDMNMLAGAANLPPLPPPVPGAPPRFPPNIGSDPTQFIYFNQPGPGRGVPNVSGPGFYSMGPITHESPHDKVPMGWTTPRNSGPAGKAPSRGEQNDYSQNFVDTGMRPQNFIRELELTNTVEDYPKLRELIQRKDDIVTNFSTPPMYYKCDLHDFVLTPEFFGTKFDVILVDPPWEEYVHRAPGVTDHLEYWQLEEIQNLKIEAIADTPSFIFLWVGDGVGLEQGRQCLKKWGFRRCEDICWVKTNKRNAAPGLRHDSRTLFQHSKEHCLMGIKGTVRRSTDGHIIHANIDTDIIIAEEPSDGSTKKPEDMYKIIEHFALGKRRLELFGEDHNIRSGWLTLGKELSSSNFNAEAYIRNFADRDGKVWQGGGGRNPPPEAGHLILTTPEIEGLRPKSPPPKNQLQPSLSLMTTGSSGNKRPSGNSPQNHITLTHSGLNLDTSYSEPATPAHWGSSPTVGSQGSAGGHRAPDDNFFNAYRLDPSCIQAVGDRIEIDPRRALNFL